MFPKRPSKAFAVIQALVLTAVVILWWTTLDASIWFLGPFTLFAAGIAVFGLWRAMSPENNEREKDPTQ